MSDKLSNESLPCPFCGCTDISEGEVLTDNPDGGASTQSMCRGCGALGPDAHLRECEVDFGSVKSTAAWNRRASPAPAIPACQCDMRTKVLGDGCETCQPENAPAISESDLLALLPGTTYMAPPDGGDASLLEQLQRMAEDAARYRWIRDEDSGVPDGMRELMVVQSRLPFSEGVDTELFDVALDAAIDAARKGGKS